MTTTALFYGGEIGSFVPSSSLVKESTLAGTFDPAFARCSIVVARLTDYSESAAIVAGDDMWIHFDILSDTLLNGVRFVWLDDAGTEVLRMSNVGNTYVFEALIAMAWTPIGTAIALPVGELQTLDIHAVVNSASGSLTCYVSGTNRMTTGAIDLSGITELGRVRFRSNNVVGGAAPTYHSQVIVDTVPTVGRRLQTRYPNGTGATADMIGGYADVDEIVYNDADFLNSATANQVELMTQTGPSTDGYVVRGIGVYGRMKKGATGPTKAQVAIRVSGTNYFSADLTLDVGYGAFGNIWGQNPATSADWLNTAVEPTQIGAKSIA